MKSIWDSIRSTVTLLLTITFCYLAAFTKQIGAKEFLVIFVMVITFYFAAKKRNGENAVNNNLALPPEPPPVRPRHPQYSVLLESVPGGKRVAIIKELRSISDLTLEHAKDLADTAPRVVKSGLVKFQAEEIKAKLEDAGARCSVVLMF